VAAFSLIELVFAVGLAATIGAAAVPQLLTSLDDIRAAAAARYLAGRLQLAKMEAVGRGRSVALRFVRSGGSFSFAAYADGNRDGVRSHDIQEGIDWLLQGSERLPDRFAGVDFGALTGLPQADPSGTAPGADPIRLGSSDMVSFSPLGTSTTGTLYLKGRRDAQYAVRVFGETGKARTLKFNRRSGEWKPL
jgi:type II secretory pathway pseudopilin PulG